MKAQFCIIGQTSLRQKLKTIQLLRDHKVTAIAMDHYNAGTQALIDKVKQAIVFRPMVNEEPTEALALLTPLGWPRDRILIEGVDFPLNELPIEKA
jgi:hypothetical protein